MALFKNEYEYRLLFVLFILAIPLLTAGQDKTGSSFIVFPGDTILQTGQELMLPGYHEGIPYAAEGYLSCRVLHHNPASSILLIRFYRTGDQQARLTCRIGILPDLLTQVIFPLNYLTAQDIFLPRFPRQLKGTANGQRLMPHEISEVSISLQQHTGFRYPEEVEISKVKLTPEVPGPLETHEVQQTLWVDSMGQWNTRNWPGKIAQTSDLEPAFQKMLKRFALEEPGQEYSGYLGFKSLRFDSTGFFHTHYDGTRWWFVDPLGYAYLSIAPTGVGPYSQGPVDLITELFTTLPDKEVYGDAWSSGNGRENLSFLTVNLIRMFGSDWKDKWVSPTRQFLLGMHFTGSGNWSDRQFRLEGRMPYFYPMWGSPRTKIRLFRDFPDVFDPDFIRSAERFAAQLIPHKDDPWMVGYFLGNEPHWAFGDFNLAREMLYNARDSYSRKELISWLQNKYGDPYALSAAWDFEITAFAELRRMIIPHEKYLSPQAIEDLMEFTRIMVDQYAEVICTAVKEADPNHLNLGLRFAWLSSEACLQTGAWFDVFSLNGYSWPNPPETETISKKLNKPVMIGEFHFGSTDRGLPATGIRGMASQRDRGHAYRYYVEHGFARPEIIGLHYFQWNDQPVTGRFDGENYNIGIMDVTYRPYPELARAMSKTNRRLLDIATGKKKPWPVKGKPMPAIYY